LLRDLERDRRICLPRRVVDEAEYYPGQDRFHRTARLCFQGAKLREDAHHLRIRGMWRCLEALEPVLRFLLRSNRVEQAEQAFAHPYPWLLERCCEHSRVPAGACTVVLQSSLVK